MAFSGVHWAWKERLKKPEDERLRLSLTWTACHPAHTFTSKEKHVKDDDQRLHGMRMGSTDWHAHCEWTVEDGFRVGGFNLWNVYWYPCLHLAPVHTLVWRLSGRLCLEQQNLLVSKTTVMRKQPWWRLVSLTFTQSLKHGGSGTKR